MRAIVAAVVLPLLSACHSHSPRPVDIDISDMCGYCRMAISQKQFATEVLDADENAVKFDDIGCMLHYVAGAERKPAAIFVMDYGTRRWVDAHGAWFLRGSKVQTPMGGNVLAFGERERAEAEAREVGGEVLSYARLWRP